MEQNHSAQCWSEATTLGDESEIESTLKGLNAWAAAMQRFQGDDFFGRVTQGSSSPVRLGLTLG
jgi:hypothetical protein